MNIKVLNFDNPDYFHTFRTLKPATQLIENLDVSLKAEINNPQCTIISNKDFIFPELSLEESIKKGIEVVRQYENVVLYDATDSTSLQGVIEILEACDNVKCLVKHQLLDREAYKSPTPYGKWFFDGFEKSYCESGYDISEKTWSRIHLSALNIYWWMRPGSIKMKRENREIFAVFGKLERENIRFGYNDAYFYNEHRDRALKNLKGITYNVNKNRLEYIAYIKKLGSSTAAVSPYGMGELCLRDIEAWSYGVPLIKPNVNKVYTLPNLWINGYTYLACSPDFSDLDEKIETMINCKQLQDVLIKNAHNVINKDYSVLILNQWQKILNSQLYSRELLPGPHNNGNKN